MWWVSLEGKTNHPKTIQIRKITLATNNHKSNTEEVRARISDVLAMIIGSDHFKSSTGKPLRQIARAVRTAMPSTSTHSHGKYLP